MLFNNDITNFILMGTIAYRLQAEAHSSILKKIERFFQKKKRKYAKVVVLLMAV